MADALAEIDASIVEVTKARQAVTRKKSKQVFSDDEIDRLKAVAYAWFQTHRPSVVAHLSQPDVQTVDAAYRSILDATGRHAARTTYVKALREAKRSLVEVRSMVAASAPTPASPSAAAAVTATTEVPPNFGPLARDPKMQAILMRRWGEVQHCAGSKAYLAAPVLMRVLLDSVGKSP